MTTITETTLPAPSPQSIATDHCAHCDLSLVDKAPISLEINGRQHNFCCRGCRGIYQLIHGDGLASFYSRREGWQPGAPRVNDVDSARFEENIRQVGDWSALEFAVGGIRCASCVWLIEKALEKLPGVEEISVNYATHKAKLSWDSAALTLDDIFERIQQFGYTPRPHLTDEQHKKANQALLLRFGTAAFCAMQLMTYSLALYAGYFQGIHPIIKLGLTIVAGVLATPVIFYSGGPFFVNAIRGLRHANFSMDSLIALGAGSAYLLSLFQIFTGGEVYFDTAVMIITLILLGRLIESGAKGRASDAVRQLAALAPEQVRCIDDPEDIAAFYMTPTSEVKVGQLFSVQPGERVPIDGRVIEGVSEVDESMLTGESKPVAKTPNDTILGGTINSAGHLLARVSNPPDETVLSQIIRSVEDAQARKAPVQALADRLVGFFVPVIFLLALGALFFALRSHTPAESIIRFVAVLIVACPCALGLATPLAILVGTGLGVKNGILIKGGEILEQTQKIDAVVLDKTGTLTTGAMSLSEIVLPQTAGSAPNSREDCLVTAASLAVTSEHAVARSILKAAQGCKLQRVEAGQVHPGLGIEGRISGLRYLLGSARFMKSSGVTIPDALAPRQEASTRVYLAAEKNLLAAFVIADQVRPSARPAVGALGQMGINLHLVSGDLAATVAETAKQIGIDHHHAEHMPEEKVAFIKGLQKQGSHVAMVGDGINDAPALAGADIGVAVAKGTDIAMESADIVLLREDLNLIPQALKLSKRTFTTIRVNLLWAVVYNLAVLPAAFLGYLHPIFCAGAMALSSLCVVANSLWLKKRGMVS